MFSWLVGAVLGIWLLLTVARNLPGLGPVLARHDQAVLLPNWALFVRPRTADSILLRRDLLRDGNLTSWREVDVACPRRRYNLIWNPGMGPRRGFIALADAVIRGARRDRKAGRPRAGQGTPGALTDMMMVPYLTILCYLAETSHAAVEATQFMIATAENQVILGRYDPAIRVNIEFVSELHRVRPRVRPREGQ
jgi:hypothetical protein